MPVQINQLHVKVKVKDEEPSASGPKGNSSGKNQEALVERCVEAVLEILERKTQR